jgi:AraC family transcriptional regulator of adaptative response / DNA-3-methyladenine glycosylase II
VELDFDRCYRAVDSRDKRFDGVFVTAVKSTGIYCRPSCPATTPKRQNVTFFATAATAQRNGFRACRRCRPDASPGSPDWNIRGDVVGRAVRLIGDGIVDREGVAGLASRLGYTTRHLDRMLTAELGAGPLALARAQRAQTARILLETTAIGLADVAFAAGFGSVRQFNDTMRDVFGRTPSEIRASRRASGTAQPGTIELRLPFRQPLHAAALLDFLGSRTIPGVDERDADTYRRALRLPHGPATAALTPKPEYVHARLQLTDVRDLAPAVARCRQLLDLDADPTAVDNALSEDPALADWVRAEPGIRVPGAVDGFEIAVRAIVGQQISVAGARTVLRKLCHATTDTGFPTPQEVAVAPDEAFAMPAARRRTIKTLAEAMAAGELVLDHGVDRAEVSRQLLGIPGIGAWTVSYVAMRALGDPDAFMPTDLGVRRGAIAAGITDLNEHAKRWAPWRSYAMIRLWRHA